MQSTGTGIERNEIANWYSCFSIPFIV